MTSTIFKRSVTIDGHKTSISLEEPFWTALKEIANAQRMTLAALLAEIDGAREKQSNLCSAIRLFVLRHFMAQRAAHGLAGERNQLQRGGLVVTLPRLRPAGS